LVGQDLRSKIKTWAPWVRDQEDPLCRRWGLDQQQQEEELAREWQPQPPAQYNRQCSSAASTLQPRCQAEPSRPPLRHTGRVRAVKTLLACPPRECHKTLREFTLRVSSPLGTLLKCPLTPSSSQMGNLRAFSRGTSTLSRTCIPSRVCTPKATCLLGLP